MHDDGAEKRREVELGEVGSREKQSWMRWQTEWRPDKEGGELTSR